MKELPLTMGYVALVDDADYERASQFKWRVQVAKWTAYGRRSVADPVTKRQKDQGLHRFILDAPDHMEVDHIDHNGLNCQRSNLRLATRTQQRWNANTNGNNTSGYKGVSWDSHKGRWRALLYHDGRKKHLGYFRELVDAAAAFRKAELFYRSEFARALSAPAQAQLE